MPKRTGVIVDNSKIKWVVYHSRFRILRLLRRRRTETKVKQCKKGIKQRRSEEKSKKAKYKKKTERSEGIPGTECTRIREAVPSRRRREDAIFVRSFGPRDRFFSPSLASRTPALLSASDRVFVQWH